jgi:hypothetical protein
VKVQVVIERHNYSKLCLRPEPSDEIPANWQEHNSHVQLGRLSTSFGSSNTIAHDLEGGIVCVFDEFPSEKASTDRQP